MTYCFRTKEGYYRNLNRLVRTFVRSEMRMTIKLRAFQSTRDGLTQGQPFGNKHELSQCD